MSVFLIRNHIRLLFNDLKADSSTETRLFGWAISAVDDSEIISEYHHSFRKPYLAEAYRVMIHCKRYDITPNPSMIGEPITALQPSVSHEISNSQQMDSDECEIIHGTIECDHCVSHNLRSDDTRQHHFQRRSADEPVSILSICNTCATRKWID